MEESEFSEDPFSKKFPLSIVDWISSILGNEKYKYQKVFRSKNEVEKWEDKPTSNFKIEVFGYLPPCRIQVYQSSVVWIEI